MRGDRPASELSNIFICEFTPHARGSTRRGTKIAPHLCVYPACAGIDRTIGHGLCGPYRLPRMRGDRPLNVKDSDSRQGFTPHARGSTPQGNIQHDLAKVYPACAGIDRHT